MIDKVTHLKSLIARYLQVYSISCRCCACRDEFF
uniref:Uncharacterized protein n=1 Tax=Anguilla anguilla TaxID=7936 RepID=A0A0E9TR23_ANGAN